MKKLFILISFLFLTPSLSGGQTIIPDTCYLSQEGWVKEKFEAKHIRFSSSKQLQKWDDMLNKYKREEKNKRDNKTILVVFISVILLGLRLYGN